MERGNWLRLEVVGRWKFAGRRAGTHSLLIWPPLALAFLVYVSIRAHALSFDLTHAYLSGARAVIHGHSPYPPALLSAIVPRTAYVYPPLTAWLVAPLTLLPSSLVAAAGFCLALATVAAIFIVLGVRDWRCWMVALLWVPTFSAIQTANVTLALTLGVALLWRYRERVLVSGIVFGLLVVLKLYLWPLAIVFVGSRAIRSAAVAALTAVTVLIASWAPIGFAGLSGYPHLVGMMTRLERGDAYTLSAALAPALSWTVADGLTTVIGLAILAFAARLAYQRDDRRAFTYAIAATLVLAPIEPMNYFVILVVVIALYQPTFGPLWALPLALWVGPQVSNGQPWQTWAVLLLVAATIVLADRSGRVTPRRGGSAYLRGRRFDISPIADA